MTDTTPSPRPRPWLKIALIASVALNLLIIGVVGGAVWKFSGYRDHAGPIGFARHLPKEARQMLRDNMNAERPAYRAMRQESQALRAEIATEIARPQMDIASVEAVMTRLRDMSDKRRQLVDATLLKTLRDLTPDQRAEIAERLSRRRKPK